MRRVALVTDSGEPSGVGRHMIDLGRGLADLGWAVRLGFGDHGQGHAFAARARAGGLEADAVADWRAWLDAHDPEAVHVHAGIGWEGHGLVAAAKPRPVVRTEHLPWLITDPGQRRAWLDHLDGVDGLIAVGAEAAATWEAALAGIRHRPPLDAIPNGVPDRGVAHRGGAGLLMIGRATPQKAHRSLFGALARLRDPPPLRLAGADDPRLARWARRLGLRVELLGPRDDVPTLMAEADLLVLPSRFEGLPLVVLEAMAAGLPVVATRVGGTVEALGEGHPFLADPGSSRDLARALDRALSDPAAARASATRARARWQSRHTAEAMASATAAALSRAVAQPRKAPMTRLGFIGAGGIAWRHFGTLGSMDDVQVVAVADPSEEARTRAADHLGARAYDSHEAMLDSEDLDAVYICVPPFAHGAPERACLARNLPFFVEKPLSLDLSLAEAIGSEVEAAGLVTATGYHWRYLDTVDEARRLLKDNPAHLMSGYWIDQTPPPRWWWREDESGGQIVEQATHIIDLARFLAGDVAEVFGLAAHRDRADFDGLTVPTASTATLRFASGAIANLAATCLLRWNHRVGLHVFGDALALEITDHDLMVDVGRGRPVRGADGDPVWREDRDFVEAVQGRENLIRAPYHEALMTHRVALAVAQSAKTGQAVSMEALRLNPQPPFRGPAAARAAHA